MLSGSAVSLHLPQVSVRKSLDCLILNHNFRHKRLRMDFIHISLVLIREVAPHSRTAKIFYFLF